MTYGRSTNPIIKPIKHEIPTPRNQAVVDPNAEGNSSNMLLLQYETLYSKTKHIHTHKLKRKIFI